MLHMKLHHCHPIKCLLSKQMCILYKKMNMINLYNWMICLLGDLHPYHRLLDKMIQFLFCLNIKLYQINHEWFTSFSQVSDFNMVFFLLSWPHCNVSHLPATFDRGILSLGASVNTKGTCHV